MDTTSKFCWTPSSPQDTFGKDLIISCWDMPTNIMTLGYAGTQPVIPIEDLLGCFDCSYELYPFTDQGSAGPED